MGRLVLPDWPRRAIDLLYEIYLDKVWVASAASTRGFTVIEPKRPEPFALIRQAKKMIAVAGSSKLA
jgi:hypothetical protein